MTKAQTTISATTIKNVMPPLFQLYITIKETFGRTTCPLASYVSLSKERPVYIKVMFAYKMNACCKLHSLTSKSHVKQ